MAELDARLTGLVQALLQSRLGSLATMVLERLNEAEGDPTGADAPDRDPFAPPSDETEDGQAARQLNLIDVVVVGRVKLELDLLDRSLELSKELSNALGLDGPEAFATVLVVDEADRAAVEGAPLAGINLLTGVRRDRLQKFLDAWRRAVSAVRIEIGGGLG